MSEQPPHVAPLAPLAAALAAARKSAPTIAKLGSNDAHNFKYAQGEDVIEACRAVLAANGLSLFPVRLAAREPTKSESIGLEGKAGRYGVPHSILCGSYWLLHESGARVDLYFETPIVPERGRPLDKATFAAETEQLAYAHRDVLGAKRGTTLDVAGREDSDDHGDQPPPARPQPPARAPAGKRREAPRQAQRAPAQAAANVPDHVRAALSERAPGKAQRPVSDMSDDDMNYWIGNITDNPGNGQYRERNIRQLQAMLIVWRHRHEGRLHPLDPDAAQSQNRQPGDDDEPYEGDGGTEDDIPY